MSFDWQDGAFGWIEADGKRLEAASHGPSPEHAPTLVLLHEGLGSVRLWRDFPERLVAATGLGVFAFSRSGYGWSDPADLPRGTDYMSHEAVTVLPEVLAAFGFRQGVTIGHSDGATIAALHAGLVPDGRLRGIVLMAPHFFTEPGGLAEIAAAREAFDQTDLSRRMARHHRDAEHTFRGWNDVWLSDGFRDWNVSDVIADWTVPALAIQGREDQYGTLEQVAVISRRAQTPVDVVVLDDCRHSPHLEQSERTLDAIRGFLAL